MRFIIYIIAVFLFSFLGLQSEIHKGKIYLNNNDVIKSKSIIIKDSVVRYRLTTEPNTIVINKKDISKIEIVDGNLGLYGLGVGLFFSLGFANYARTDKEFYTTIAAGGCIGLFLGTLINDYHTIRFDDNDSLSFFNGVKLMPETNQPNLTLINYSVSF